MTRVKKITIGLSVVVLLLLTVIFFVGNHLLNSYSRQAMTAIAKRGKKHGVAIAEPSFEQARISGIRTARWTDLRARLQFPDNEAFDPNRSFDVHVSQVEIWLSGGGQVDLEAHDVTVVARNGNVDKQALPAAEDPKSERIHAGRFYCRFEMDVLNPLPDLINVLPELVGLMKAGATQIPIVTEGELEFTLKGQVVKTGIWAAEVEGGQALVLRAEDLRPISSLFDEALTDAEIDLVSIYPLRAAQLLRIKDDAESTARAAYERDDQVPQDAYRHVLWSYLLTNRYGRQFAQRVTDAHEQGETGNTPAEREMDYHNNAIGRGYSEHKVRRTQILTRVQSDESVLRSPR
jgi:hypothetical protein